MENIPQAFTPPPGRLGHSMPAPERVGSPLEKMSFRAQHKPNAWARKEVEDGLAYHSQMLPQTKEAFGSPSFPAPLDKIRSRQEYRVTLDTVTELSPELSTTATMTSDEQRTNPSVASGHELDHFTGGSMLSYSYNSQSKLSVGDSYLNNSFIRSFTRSLNTSLNVPSMHMSTNSSLFPSTARCPNKAMVTISAQSSQILVANRTACELFGYRRHQLLEMKVHSLFAEPYQAKQQALVEQHIDMEGGVVLVAGKVTVIDIMNVVMDDFLIEVIAESDFTYKTMDAVNSNGEEFPVSVWMKKIGSDGKHRVIVVIEPVARSSAKFGLDHEGNICTCDTVFAQLFGYQATDDLSSKPATELMPSLVIPSLNDDECDHTKQRITGRLIDGTAFPITVQFDGRNGDIVNNQLPVVYSGKVSVYATLSGMVTFFPNGKIHGCNHHFILMLTGYTADQLKGQDITMLIPEFYLHIDVPDNDSIPLPPGLEDSHSSSIFHAVPEDGVLCFNDTEDQASESKDDSGISNNEQNLQQKNLLEENGIANETTHSSDNDCSQSNKSFLDSSIYSEGNISLNNHQHKSVLDDQASPHKLKNIPPEKRPRSAIETSSQTPPLSLKLFASTPASLKLHSGGGAEETADPLAPKFYIPEGTFLGDAMHIDGSLFSIVFQLKCIILSDSSELFCMWISRDFPLYPEPTDDSLSCEQQLQPNIVDSPAWVGANPLDSFTEEGTAPWAGEYEKDFDTLKQIGKGAFGYVNLAQRKKDCLVVVVKFICKRSVLQDCWIEDKDLGCVPLEISILTKVNHVNIVKLLAAYENDEYFQMVMQKHGDGMDLFDFIDKNPSLDEPLVSYMFRQIIDAVAYLHGKKILHRDIKDENIILDHCFTIKLIDFGSAAFMEEGKVFGTFCGTLEYCAPEVLLGNKYSGPALEMWSIGVTLYTLVFGENPFFDVEETISGHLQPPFPVSPGLLKVILWLLHPDPSSRATIKDLQVDKWTTQSVDINDYLFEAVINGWSYIRKEKTSNGTGELNASKEDMQESHVMNRNGETNNDLNTSNPLATSL